MTNANSDAYELAGQWFTDQYDVEGAEAGLFRPEHDGKDQNGEGPRTAIFIRNATSCPWTERTKTTCKPPLIWWNTWTATV